MSKTHKNFFYPKNPEKCNNQVPYYKSSWELKFMRLCDEHPGILSWAYEPLKIRYLHPFTGKYTIYVPDFIIVTLDRSKTHQVTQIIEIKPKKEAVVEAAKDKRSKERLIVNAAKWEACQRFAQEQGFIFKVVTEDQMFG